MFGGFLNFSDYFHQATSQFIQQQKAEQKVKNNNKIKTQKLQDFLSYKTIFFFVEIVFDFPNVKGYYRPQTSKKIWLPILWDFISQRQR